MNYMGCTKKEMKKMKEIFFFKKKRWKLNKLMNNNLILSGSSGPWQYQIGDDPSQSY